MVQVSISPIKKQKIHLVYYGSFDRCGISDHRVLEKIIEHVNSFNDEIVQVKFDS